MNVSPPQGSPIQVGTYNGAYQLIVPFSKGSKIRFLIAAFLLFWLGGWTMGFKSALGDVLSGEGGLFLIFWLGGWTIGGVASGYFLYRILKKPVPMKILLNKPNLTIDTGSPPFEFSTSNRRSWKELMRKRKFYELVPDQIKSLSLWETSDGNRLTVDVGIERIEIGNGLLEVEKEWIHNYLEKIYS